MNVTVQQAWKVWRAREVLCGSAEVGHALQAFKGTPIPARGKISAVFGGKSCEAVLQLPTAPTKQACANLAPVVWLTVGLLAVQGIAVQVPAPEIQCQMVVL